MNSKAIFIAAGVLALFGIAGSSLVAFTWDQTEERILANERQALLRQLNALVPADSVNNDMIEDRIEVSNLDLLGSDATTVYLGRRDDQPVAAVFNTVAPNGYSGPVKLLVAIKADGVLGGVRVVSHKETPGLGDKIEETRSDWILGFTGKYLGDPPEDRWGVRKDGGVFDQFTGATITPRIVVAAVKRTLEYYREVGMTIFDRPPAKTEETSG